MKLGVSMIVRNEAECIESCLESIKGADEIVIVDTGSDDNTVEICQRYTDRVYTDYKWNDDFSEARNVALSRMTADWILIIDADEQLLEPLDKLKTMIRGDFMKKYKAVNFFVHTKTEKIKSIRMIRNDPKIRWEQEAHNVLVYRDDTPLTGDEEKDLDIGNSALRAMSYDSHLVIKSDYSKAHFIDPDRTFKILSKMLDRNPAHGRATYYLAREYINRCLSSPKDTDQWHENNQKVIELLESYVEMTCRNDWTNLLADAFHLLSLAYAGENDWWNGVKNASLAFMILPSYKAPAYYLSIAMADPPRGMHKMMEHSAFWRSLYDKANNAGVAQVREVEK